MEKSASLNKEKTALSVIDEYMIEHREQVSARTSRIADEAADFFSGLSRVQSAPLIFLLSMATSYRLARNETHDDTRPDNSYIAATDRLRHVSKRPLSATAAFCKYLIAGRDVDEEGTQADGLATWVTSFADHMGTETGFKLGEGKNRA